MKQQELIKDKIPFITIEDNIYFLLDSIKEKYGQVKYESKQIKKVDNKAYIQAEYVEKFTEFDKHMHQALNFKIKK